MGRIANPRYLVFLVLILACIVEGKFTVIGAIELNVYKIIKMTKREQYGLSFINWVNPIDKTVKKVCRRENVNTYSELQMINRLSNHEVYSLLQSIQNAINGEYFEEIYSSERIDDQSIEIHPPNVIINEICIIPLIDMRDLLQEWITFMNQ